MEKAMGDEQLWCASGGLMASQSLSFAEKVRQARHLDSVLEGFSSSDEEDIPEEGLDMNADFEAALERSAKAAAKAAMAAVAAAAANPSRPISAAQASDTDSNASTRLASGCSSVPSSSGSNSLPQSASGQSVASSCGSHLSFLEGGALGPRSNLTTASSCSSPSSRGSSAAALSPSRRGGGQQLPPLRVGDNGRSSSLSDSSAQHSPLRWQQGGSSEAVRAQARATVAAAASASYMY